MGPYFNSKKKVHTSRPILTLLSILDPKIRSRPENLNPKITITIKNINY